mgnify:CR=1 FL=1
MNNGLKTLKDLDAMLTAYRNNERDFPSYEDLAALLKAQPRVSCDPAENEAIARDAQAIVDEDMATFRQGPTDFQGGFRIPRPPEEIAAAATAAIAPPVAAGSVGMPEIDALLAEFAVSSVRVSRGGSKDDFHAVTVKFLGVIDAWGAQQHEAGYHEGVAQLRHERDSLLMFVTEAQDRAEKAEARAITAEDRLAAANSMLTGVNAELKNAEARVKELDAELDTELVRAYDRLLAARASKKAGRQALQAEGKHPAPCARDCEANAFQIEVRRLQAVELDMHRKLAAETLRADQGWARYEAANRAKNDLEREKADRASPYWDGLPNEIQHHPV